MTMSNTFRRPSYARQADILGNVIISDNPADMGLDKLPQEIQIAIVTARLMGYHPVSMKWSTGEFAVVCCAPGTTMPPPEKILEAFYQCRRTNKTFPAGVLS